jgi:hypothetical protein
LYHFIANLANPNLLGFALQLHIIVRVLLALLSEGDYRYYGINVLDFNDYLVSSQAIHTK